MADAIPLLSSRLQTGQLCLQSWAHLRSHVMFVLCSIHAWKQLDRTFAWVRSLLQQYPHPSEGIIVLNQDLTFQLDASRALPSKRPPSFALLQLSADVLSLFLETWPWGVLEWRILHASWRVCVSPYCFLWSVADKISLGFCGPDESHGSGPSIWNLIFGIIMMLPSVHLKIWVRGLRHLELSGEYWLGQLVCWTLKHILYHFLKFWVCNDSLGTNNISCEVSHLHNC